MKRYALILAAVGLMVVSVFFSQGDECQFTGNCTPVEYLDRYLEYGAITLFVIGLFIYLLSFKKRAS